jgi:anti-sigma factor RsiW
MASCRDIEPLMTAYVDGEASGAERSAVSDHLRECGRCRAQAADEEAGRHIMRERATACRVEAPAGLRARCMPPAPRPRAIGWLVVRPVPVWATVVVVCALAIGALFAAGRATTVFAAELAVDHVKCFTLFGRASTPGDPAAIGKRLKAAYGWTLAVPGPSETLGLRLVGGRRCLSTDGSVAHILYRHGDRALSLFVVPSDTRAPRDLAVVGYEAIIWSHAGNTYVVLARESHAELARVAAYMRSIVEAPGS